MQVTSEQVTNESMTTVLETDRVALRQFTEADAASLFMLDSDPEVMRYIGPYSLPDEAAYRERIRTYFQPYYAANSGHWVLVGRRENDAGKFLGWFHLRPAREYRFAREAGFADGEFDVGYRLVRAAWNRGYATEVTRALVSRGLGLPAVRAVVACVLIENLASVRVLEKSGMQKVNQFSLPGFSIPAAKYAISRESSGTWGAQATPIALPAPFEPLDRSGRFVREPWRRAPFGPRLQELNRLVRRARFKDSHGANARKSAPRGCPAGSRSARECRQSAVPVPVTGRS